MEIITKILKGKQVRKLINIPTKLVEVDLKVTVEACETNQNTKNQIKYLEDLFKLAREVNFKVPPNIKIEKLDDDMLEVKI